MNINLCSGQRPFDSRLWVNIDVNPKWQPEVVADGASMPMFADGSADVIVIHHGVEHAGCGEATPMIRECHRILRMGGSLLVFVPDMRALAQMYLEGVLSTQVYMTNVYGAFMSDEADRHKWGYDRTSLHKFLKESAPWSRVQGFDWRTIEGADIAGPARWILSCEAIK